MCDTTDPMLENLLRVASDRAEECAADDLARHLRKIADNPLSFRKPVDIKVGTKVFLWDQLFNADGREYCVYDCDYGVVQEIVEREDIEGGVYQEVRIDPVEKPGTPSLIVLRVKND